MKDAPQSGLAKFRFQRLTACRSILGEPDLLSICEMKSTQSFFGKEKKTYDLKETFISGLAFPTTAHFSSFILSRYQTADNKKLALKVRLFMFDVL